MYSFVSRSYIYKAFSRQISNYSSKIPKCVKLKVQVYFLVIDIVVTLSSHK